MARSLILRRRAARLITLAVLALELATGARSRAFGAEAYHFGLPLGTEATDAEIRTIAEGLLAQDPKAREEAQRRLLALGPSGVAPLFRIASKGPMPLALAIKELMPRFGPASIEPLCDAAKALAWELQSPAVHPMWIFAGEVMAAIGDQALPGLLRMFQRRGWQESHYAACAGTALAQMPTIAAPALAAYLKDPREDVRRNAATLLARFRDPRTVDALIEGLKSPDSGVRLYSARGLGDMREERAIEPLLAMMGSDSGVEGRRAAAAALGKMYQPRFREPLAQMARFGDERDVRETAANVLIYSGYPKAARIGRRYKPPNVGVDDWWMVIGWYAHAILLTAMLVYLLIWAGAKHLTGSRPDWALLLQASWGAAVALLVFGFLWGRVFTGLSVWAEWSLLLLGLPATAGFAWLVGTRARLLRRVAVSYIGTYLVGIGIVVAGALVSGPVAFILGLVVGPYLMPVSLAFALLVAVVSAVSVYRREGSTTPRAFRLAAVAGTGVFYLGYGLGWLALWGYLGF